MNLTLLALYTINFDFKIGPNKLKPFLLFKNALCERAKIEIIFEKKRTRSRLWGKAGINDTVVGGIIEKHP